MTTPSSGWSTVTHSLGADIDGLVADVYVKYRTANNGYTAN